MKIDLAMNLLRAGGVGLATGAAYHSLGQITSPETAMTIARGSTAAVATAIYTVTNSVQRQLERAINAKKGGHRRGTQQYDHEPDGPAPGRTQAPGGGRDPPEAGNPRSQGPRSAPPDDFAEQIAALKARITNLERNTDDRTTRGPGERLRGIRDRIRRGGTGRPRHDHDGRRPRGDQRGEASR